MSPKQPDTTPPEEKVEVEVEVAVDEEGERYQGGEIPRVESSPEQTGGDK